MTTTVIRVPKRNQRHWDRNNGGMSLKHMGDTVVVSDDSDIFKYEMLAKSLALLLFDTPATLTWSEQDRVSLTALVSFSNKTLSRYFRDVSVGLGRAVLKGQINPGDVIQQLETKCDCRDTETGTWVKAKSILITPKSAEDMRLVLRYLDHHDYLIELSVAASGHSVPRTVDLVDVTSLKILDLSSNKLVQAIEDWNGFVLGKLSRFPNLQYLILDKNGLGRNACDALATMLSRGSCNLLSLYLKDNDLDNGCVEVLTSSLRANTKLETLELNKNDQITSQEGGGLLFQLLGGRDTPTST
ncbi:hypothetical protein THAOC_27407, partial [Thalassiosira oceanica]